MKQVLVCSLVALATLVGTPGAEEKAISLVSNENRPGLSVEELAVSVDHGSLEIIDTTGTNIAVEAFRLVNGIITREPSANTDYNLRREENSLVLNLSAHGLAGMVFRLHVPGQMRLSLKSSHGHITVTNHDGALKVDSSVGQVRLGRIGGRVDARTSAGELWLASAESAAMVRTSGGKMTLGEIAGPSVLESSGGSIIVRLARSEVIAKSSGGSITVHSARDGARLQASGGSITVNLTAQPKRECVFQTTNGSVQLGLPPTLNLRIAARSDGEVNTDLPVDWRDTHERYRRGLLNSPDGTVTIQAEGGKVSILSIESKTIPAEALFGFKPSVIDTVGLAKADPVALAAPPANAPPHHKVQSAPDPADIPRIEREANVWQNADWKPVVLLPKGVLMRDGRMLEAEVTGLDDFQVRYRTVGGSEESAKLSQVAAILFQPLPNTQMERLEGNGRGVLLRPGDFFEGDFRQLDTNQVTLSSVLFGLKKFNLKTEVSALILHRP